MDYRINVVARLLAFPVLTVVLLFVADGSSVSSQTQRSGPTLVLVDSIVLQETEALYLGQPKEMFVGPDSSLYVIDAFANSVVRFNQRGRAIQSYGREGEGPGEFVHIGKAGFASATILGIVDGYGPPEGAKSTQVIEFFAVQSGETIGKARVTDITALALNRDTVWLAGIDVGAGWTAIAARELSGLYRQPSGEITSLNLVTVPRPYMVNGYILGLGGYARIHVNDDDVILGFGAIPYLLRITKGGHIRDTIPLQAAQRAWLADEEELLRVMDPASPSEGQFGATSALMNVSRDKGGRIFTVHQESKRLGPGRVGGKLYVSKLESDGSVQCPDTHIPTSGVGRPISAFRGSDLFVLDQRISAGGTGALQTLVRRFRVDPERCTGEIASGSALPGRASAGRSGRVAK